MTTSFTPSAGSAPASSSDSALTNCYSNDSERLILGILLNQERVSSHLKLISLIGVDDFFFEPHQTAWRIINTLREAGVSADVTSVCDHAQQYGEFIGGALYLSDCFNDPICRMCSDESIEAASSRIKNFSMTRKLQVILQAATTMTNNGEGFEHVSGHLEDSITNLKRLSHSSQTGPQPAAVFYESILAKLLAKLDGEVITPGISVGFDNMDRIMGGELPKEGLVVLAARPGMGKTAFATAIEQNISSKGVPTLFFSLEMTGVSLAQRNLSRHSRIAFSAIKSNTYQDHDYATITESLHLLGAAPAFIDETPGLSLAEIRARSRIFVQNNPGGVIFIDYIQIVQPGRDSKAKDPRYVVGETSQGLVQMARELKCPVVALSQLSRDLEKRTNKRPVMSDLRESGQIEQDASIILFLYRDEIYNPDTQYPGTTEVIFAKNRDGACETVRFASDLSRMLYQEVGAYNDE